LVLSLSHEDRIENAKHVYLQVACLHTNRLGQRLIRVHTLRLPVTHTLSNVFRYCEIEAVSTTLLKQAANLALAGAPGYKDKLTKTCVDILHAYRIHCASTTSAGQLILPEALKMLPLYINSMRKMPVFRSGTDVRMDERVAALTRMLAIPVAQVIPLLYPRILTMIPLTSAAGLPTGVGDNVYMPSTVTCSIDKLEPDRIYLVDNGVSLQMYFRDEVQSSTLESIFGVTNMTEVPKVLCNPEADLSQDARRVLAMVDQIRREKSRQPWQPLHFVLPKSLEEPRLQAMLCEDRIANEMHYVDFLCHIHKLVQNKLD